MVRCPDCGHENPSRNRYCWYDGYPLQTGETEDEWNDTDRGRALTVETVPPSPVTRRGYLKYGIAAVGGLSIIGVGAAAYYATRPAPTPIQTITHTHAITRTYTPKTTFISTPTQVPTSIPTPEQTRETFDFEILIDYPEIRLLTEYNEWLWQITVKLISGIPKTVSLYLSNIQTDVLAHFSPSSGVPTFKSQLTIRIPIDAPIDYFGDVTASSEDLVKSTELFAPY